MPSGKARKTLQPPTAKQEQSALPLSPEQMPPRPPKVTYLDGQLTILAENSSLADILSAVSSQTGVVIDLPPGSGSDRVASRMGPGPARDVLAALLNGSRFDYVMTGSPSNPAGVEHIILIPRGDGSESTSPMGNPGIAANLAGSSNHLSRMSERRKRRHTAWEMRTLMFRSSRQGRGLLKRRSLLRGMGSSRPNLLDSRAPGGGYSKCFRSNRELLRSSRRTALPAPRDLRLLRRPTTELLVPPCLPPQW